MSKRIHEFVVIDENDGSDDDSVIWALINDEQIATVNAETARTTGITGIPTDFIEAKPGLDIDLTRSATPADLVTLLRRHGAKAPSEKPKRRPGYRLAVNQSGISILPQHT